MDHSGSKKDNNDDKKPQSNFFNFTINPGDYSNESEARNAKRKARAEFFRNRNNKAKSGGNFVADNNSNRAEA